MKGQAGHVHSTLPRSTGAHERDIRAGLDLEGKIAQDSDRWASGVPEVDILKFDVPLDLLGIRCPSLL